MSLVAFWVAAVSALSAQTYPTAGQIEFHGNVYPIARLTILEQPHYLSLPHRILSLEGKRVGQKVSLLFSTALEYRLSSNEVGLELREAYVEFSTSRGNFRFGKQIIAWGVTDDNNPTDNVNPYDFSYLFVPGYDRKVGNVMAVADLSFGALNLEVVITPIFQPNQRLLNEPDLPIFSSHDFHYDLNELYPPTPDIDLKNAEVGLRLHLPLSPMDISLSYFRGFDHVPSLVFKWYPLKGDFPSCPYYEGLGFYRTQVFGSDFALFMGNWEIRGEGAYFLTEDRKGEDSVIRNPYIQYVIQLDRLVDNYSLLVQYLGTYITKINNEWVFNPPIGTVYEETNERYYIFPKMGMPFANIAQNAVLAAASRDFADGRYSLQGQTLYDLDHQGYMVGGGLTITLEDAFDLEVGLTYLGGDENSRLSTIGESFSHVYIGMKYSF